MRFTKKTSLVLLATGTAVLLASAVAWACTPGARITSISPLAGPAGTDVIIVGTTPPDLPLEIRWASETGPVLATAHGPSFSTAFKVPGDTAPGVYYVMFNKRAIQTFQVTDPTGASPAGARSVSSSLWNGLDAQAGSPASTPDVAAQQVPVRSPGLAVGLLLFAAGGICLLGTATLWGIRGRRESRTER